MERQIHRLTYISSFAPKNDLLQFTVSDFIWNRVAVDRYFPDRRLEKSGETPLLNSGADTRRRIQYEKERALQIARVHASRCRVGRRPRSLAAKCEDLPQRDLTVS